MIIKKTDKPFHDRQVEARLLLSTTTPVDVFVLTPEEFESAKQIIFWSKKQSKQAQLSMANDDSPSQQWLKYAAEDLAWTQANIKQEIWCGACFTAQQATDKALKAYLKSREDFLEGPRSCGFTRRMHKNR